MKPYLICPSCGSHDVMKTAPLVGASKTISAVAVAVNTLREASYVENSQWEPVDPDTQATLDRLLLERIP